MLSEETKQSISRTIGIPYEELIKLDIIQAESIIEKKIGKKITWNKNRKIEGLKPRTIEEVNIGLDKITKDYEKQKRLSKIKTMFHVKH